MTNVKDKRLCLFKNSIQNLKRNLPKSLKKILNKCLSYVKSFFLFNIKCIFHCLPLDKNKIVFYETGGYQDNPKYITEELLHQKLSFKLVWIVRDLNILMPKEIKKIKSGTIRALFEVATTKIFIDDSKSGVINAKKKNQIYIQTWHGDFPLKYIEKEAETLLPIWYVENSKRDSAVTDFIISGSAFFTNICKYNFWLPQSCKILEIGCPRNDIYFKDESYKGEVRTKMKIGQSKKILLYAPTFRDDNSTIGYFKQFDKLRQFLNKITNEDWIIIVRLHDNARGLGIMFDFNKYILDGSYYSDVQELNLISDMLITDYSSIMIDFFIMQKPVFLYTSDLDSYMKKRGLRDINLPIYQCKDFVELKEELKKFNKENYLTSVNNFLTQEFKSFSDGHSSERIVDVIKECMEVRSIKYDNL